MRCYDEIGLRPIIVKKRPNCGQTIKAAPSVRGAEEKEMFKWFFQLFGAKNVAAQTEANSAASTGIDTIPEGKSLSQRQVEEIWERIMVARPTRDEIMDYVRDPRFRKMAMEAWENHHPSPYFPDLVQQMRDEADSEIKAWLATQVWDDMEMSHHCCTSLTRPQQDAYEVECWEVIVTNPTEQSLVWVLRNKFDQWEEAARLLLSINPQSNESLRLAMKAEGSRDEAWKRLSPAVTTTDILWVIKEIPAYRVEATEMLLSRRVGIKVWMAMFSYWGWASADACPTLEKVVQILERSLSLEVMSSLHFLPGAYTERIWTVYLHTIPSSEDLWMLVGGGNIFSVMAWCELKKKGNWSLNSLLGLVYRGSDAYRTEAMDILLGQPHTPEWWDVMLKASRHAFGELAHRAAAPIFENLEKAPDEILQSLSTDAWLDGEWREKARVIYLGRIKSQL